MDSLARRRFLATLAAGSLAHPLLARAEDYPSRPVHIVVPVPAGGQTDLLARKLAEKMTASMGQPMIVDNRTGAAGLVGAAAVAKSPPDGYTLLLGFTGILSISPSLYAHMPLDPVKELEPVTMLVSSPLVLAARAQGPYHSLQDLLNAARARPDAVSYGSSGKGTSMHLTGEMLSRAAKVKLLHAPYRGSIQSVQDLLGGTIDTAISDVPFFLPYLRDGRLRALAVTGSQRHPLLPDTPTFAEAGVPGVDVLSWQGLFAPAGIPAPVRTRVYEDAVQAMRSPEVGGFMASQGYTVATMEPAKFAQFLQSDRALWGAAVRDAGIKPE